MGAYDSIQVPIQGQPASASLFGNAVRNALIDVDARLSIVENLTAPMPDPVKIGANGVNSITSAVGVWANLPTNTFSAQIANPSTVFDMWCIVLFGAWMIGQQTGNVRMSLLISGGVSVTEDPIANGLAAYGMMPLEGDSVAGNTRQHMGAFSLKIPAGAATVTFVPRVQHSTSPTTPHQCNYPSLEIMPYRFSKP